MDTHPLQQALAQAVERERQRQASEIVETQIRVVTAAYDRGTAYTNLIVLAGYAGFFALWQMAQQHLSKSEQLWSALLMLISILAFVLFEIVKMIHVQRLTIKKAVALQSGAAKNDPVATLAALHAIESSFETLNVWFMRYWALTMIICVGFGLVAVAVLVTAFLRGLSA